MQTPIRLTIRKHYFFSRRTTARLGGVLAGPRAWDALRSEAGEPDFALPQALSEWRSRCADPRLIRRGKLVASIAQQIDASAVVSYGVGAACVEYHAHLADPTLELHLSDFATETVRRLRRLFPEAASIEVVDLLQDDLSAVSASLTVLHRIDTEFSDEDFRTVFHRLLEAGHKQVLVVPTGFLTPRELIAELVRRIQAGLLRRASTSVGYVRTRNAFRHAWAGAYRIRVEGSASDGSYFLLEADPRR